jgi:hypothetical protein
MRLEAVRCPDALHAGVAETQRVPPREQSCVS